MKPARINIGARLNHASILPNISPINEQKISNKICACIKITLVNNGYNQCQIIMNYD